jgi:hypothetical protein
LAYKLLLNRAFDFLYTLKCRALPYGKIAIRLFKRAEIASANMAYIFG